MSRIVVKGSVQFSRVSLGDHAVVKSLWSRKRYLQSLNDSNFSAAAGIEGGGMRGCVSAGMVTAIAYLGLRDCFDEVYGSSAGSLIGAYFVTGQLPWEGPEVYYDCLTHGGSTFIDGRRLLRSVGLGLADPRLIKDVMKRKYGKPVFKLDYLLNDVVKRQKPLDYLELDRRCDKQPLNVVASGLLSEKAVCLNKKSGNWNNVDDLTECIWASMLLPGIAGPPVSIKKGDNFVYVGGDGETVLGGGETFGDSKGEPMCDALVYEPIPYRTPVREGATHVLVCRTKPDGGNVCGKPSFFERLIMRRFWVRKTKLRRVFKYMSTMIHKKLYAEDFIYLNDRTRERRDWKDLGGEHPHVMAMALPEGSPEIGRTETNRVEIFEGVRRGFAAAYDALVEDPEEQGKGMEVAKMVFKDEIMNSYDPLEEGWEEWCERNGRDPWEGLTKNTD